MEGCRFEIEILRSGKFHCAVIDGPSGWAHTWAHNNFDPCANCPVKINGKPHTVPSELKPAEFMQVSGQLIRAKDWGEIEKRGYRITKSGIKKV